MVEKPSFFKPLNKVETHTMMLAYGQPGTGKTSFIASLPGKVLALDLDRGMASIQGSDVDIVVAELDSSKQLDEALQYAGEFDSIVLDNLTALLHKLQNEAKEEAKVERLLINHYGDINNKMKAYVDTFLYWAKKGKNVYLIAQESVDQIENEDTGAVTTIIQPKLSPGVLSHVMQNSRIIVRMEKHVKQEIVGGKKTEKEIYQARLGGKSHIVTKVTKSKQLKIPNTVKEPTWEFIKGLTTGETQKKIKQKKEETK